MGVDEPEDRDSLFVLRLPSWDVMVLFEISKNLLPPLKRRRAEKAEFMVPIDESVFAMDGARDPFERYVLLLRDGKWNHELLGARALFLRSIAAAHVLSLNGPRAF